jgi:hypothetical protein
MSMTDDEREIMVLTIRQAVSDGIKPITDRIGLLERASDRHEQALTGVNGQNGIVGHVNELMTQMSEMRTFKAQIIALAGAAGTAASLAVTWAKSLIGK